VGGRGDERLGRTSGGSGSPRDTALHGRLVDLAEIESQQDRTGAAGAGSNGRREQMIQPPSS